MCFRLLFLLILFLFILKTKDGEGFLTARTPFGMTD